jgi:hypothetical protein
MGKDAQVRAVLAEGLDEGRLQYEPPKLIFRGHARRVFEGEGLAGVRAEGGDLVLADGSRFQLGEKAAASWCDAILNPKGRLDKLGVKPSQRVAILGLDDADFAAELDARIGALADGDGLDLLFYGADSAEALSRVAGILPRLAPRGAIWVVSFKGRAAKIKDVDVFAALRPLGLVDTKVCSFSETRTALRFVRKRPD